jgi:hypothetical protein
VNNACTCGSFRDDSCLIHGWEADLRRAYDELDSIKAVLPNFEANGSNAVKQIKGMLSDLERLPIMLSLLQELLNAQNDLWLGNDAELWGRVREALGIVEEPIDQSPLCKCGHSQDSHDYDEECWSDDSLGIGCRCTEFQLKE